MRLKIYILIFFLSTPGIKLQSQGSLYIGETGTINFKSDAPLELIAASSNYLSGALDVESRQFFFKIPNKTFNGFNSAVQQEHFHENYLESNKYPRSTFNGKVIEAIDLSRDTVLEVRAKGILDIHGVKQERIIKSTIDVNGDTLNVNSTFTVLLDDHNILIPKVVYNKIAEIITVEVEIELVRKDPDQ